jgi:hypothetical protein
MHMSSRDGDSRRLTRRSLVAGLPLTGLLLTGCGMTRRGADYSYRLTLSIDANGVTHTGSSVVHVHEWDEQTIDEGWMGQSSIRGEATTVQLGDGRVVAALLTSPTNTLLRDNGVPLGAPRDDPSVLGAVEDDRASHDLSYEQVPQLIGFLRADDPNSAIALDPTNLHADLGPDVRLRGARIEVTDGPVTTGIERLLPWLDARRRAEGRGGLRTISATEHPDWMIAARNAADGSVLLVNPSQLKSVGAWSLW